MAGYDDYQTEEEYIAASKRRVTMADTKELVELARKLSAQIDPTFVGGRDANLLNKLADTIESLERERDEAREAAAFHEHNWQQERDLKLALVTELTTLRARVAKMEGVLRQVVHACFHYTGEDQDDLVNDAYDNAASLLSQEEQQP